MYTFFATMHRVLMLTYLNIIFKFKNIKLITDYAKARPKVKKSTSYSSNLYQIIVFVNPPIPSGKICLNPCPKYCTITKHLLYYQPL